MAAERARVRLWASAVDYLDISFCYFGAGDNDPVFRTKDQFGHIHDSLPPEAAALQQWAVNADLTVATNHIHKLNSLADRTWADWLRYWCREQQGTFLAYVETRGADESGAAIAAQGYYQLRLAGVLPKFLGGTRTGLAGSLPKTFTLPFTCFDEGSLIDWDTHDVDLEHAITGASTSLDQFTIAGDYAARFAQGASFRVQGSTGNDTAGDDAYTCVVDAVDGAGNTTIQVLSVASAVADGRIYRANCLSRGERP